MANVNITQLPAVTTMKGTDEFPIGRDGTSTNKVTYDTLSGSIRTTFGSTLDDSLFEDNGYVKFTNGFIMQWGKAIITGSNYVIPFPIPFPNKTFNVVATPVNTTGYIDLLEINAWTLSTVTIVVNANGVNQVNGTVTWQAYGY
jgi:hypothetical protein